MSDNPDTTTADEWLSVSDCARRLGVSERTIQRRVKHLPPSDIQRRPGQPQRVRFLALVESVPAVSASESDRAAIPDTQPTPAHNVEHLLQEIEFLRRQLDAQVSARERSDAELRAIIGRLSIQAKETAQEAKPSQKSLWGRIAAFWKGRE